MALGDMSPRVKPSRRICHRTFMTRGECRKRIVTVDVFATKLSFNDRSMKDGTNQYKPIQIRYHQTPTQSSASQCSLQHAVTARWHRSESVARIPPLSLSSDTYADHDPTGSLPSRPWIRVLKVTTIQGRQFGEPIRARARTHTHTARTHTTHYRCAPTRLHQPGESTVRGVRCDHR